MALTDPQELWARRRVVADVFGAAPVTVTKQDIDDSVAALVTLLEATSTQTAIGNAMVGTALAGATTAVKAKVFAIAALARYGEVT